MNLDRHKQLHNYNFLRWLLTDVVNTNWKSRVALRNYLADRKGYML